jgi:hypothetical protein
VPGSEKRGVPIFRGNNMVALFAEVFINQETHTGVIIYDKDGFGHNVIVYGDGKLVNQESVGQGMRKLSLGAKLPGWKIYWIIGVRIQ